MRTRWMMALGAMVVVAATMTAAASSQKAKNKEGAKPAVAVPAVAASDANSAQTASGYVIGPQDVLQIVVWKEAELSGSVPVRPDGKISLALLNDVQAAGLTPMALGADLAAKLKKYVSEPLVTVTVIQMNSQRFFVMGEVAHAGGFPLTGGETVLQGLSNAGGFSLYANSSKIYVLRTENGQQVKLPFNYKAVIKGEHPEQNIMLRAGDTIVVP